MTEVSGSTDTFGARHSSRGSNSVSQSEELPEWGVPVEESPFSKVQRIITFVIINFALFISYALYSLPGAFLPLYNLDRGISSGITGLILACVPLCYIVVCPIAGKLLDRFSSKKMLLIASGILTIITFVCAALGNIHSNKLFILALIILRLIQGACGGVIDVIAFAITTKIFPNNIALTTSIIETSLNVAVAIAPFLGGVLYTTGGFYLSFVVTAAGVALVLFTSICGVSNVDTRRDDAGGNLVSVIKQVAVWFPAWHSAASMILFNYYIPILSPYVQARFGEGPQFSGLLLMINTAGICIAAPFLGHAMDKFNPYIFFASSSILLPVCYLFLGPAPFFLGLIAPSKTQLAIVLVLIGLLVPLGCYPGLLIMYDVYKVRFGSIPQSVKNYITSIYCASFPLGGFIGSAISGLISEYATFSYATMYVSFTFLIETLLMVIFCVIVYREKTTRKEDYTSEKKPLLS